LRYQLRLTEQINNLGHLEAKNQNIFKLLPEFQFSFDMEQYACSSRGGGKLTLIKKIS